MNIRSIASILLLGSMIAGSYSESAKASPISIDPSTAMLITATGIAAMESPRVIKAAKASVARMLHKAWTKVKSPIITATNKAATVGAIATAASGLLGALCDYGDLNTPVFNRQIDKNTFYSLSATLLPLSYLAYYTARTLSQKPQRASKKKQPMVEVRVHGDCAQVTTQTT